MKFNTWVVGLGQMASEYAKVLKKLKIDFISIGRSKIKSDFSSHHTQVFDKGLRSFIKINSKPPRYAIVAVNIEQLFTVTYELINFRCKYILLEKPGSLSIKELNKLKNIAKNKGVKIHIAYNRRYYESVNIAKKLYLKNNKILSVQFDFTEIKSRFIDKFPKRINENWLLCNSSHILDLVFHIIGKPRLIKCNTYGPNFIGKRKSIFIGNGISVKNIPFSYHSNWSSGGNWSINFMTKTHKIILSPLEELKFQQIGKFSIQKHHFKSKDDTEFKPGLKKMIIDFFYHRSKIKLPTIEEQIENFRYYKKIGKY